MTQTKIASEQCAAHEAKWTARIGELVDRAQDEIADNEDFTATISAADAACKILHYQLPEDELASWFDDDVPECICPPEMVARGGWRSVCPACGNGGYE